MLTQILILIALTASIHASTYKVNPSTQFFIDQYNRSCLFHGVNAIYKLPPYYPPILDSFDPLNSLSDQDYQNLRQWGINNIRLYISWEGTEQVRGQYNETYMSQVKNIVQAAAKYNITVTLDAHQDLISRKLCGEGFPDWAVNRTDFPAPLTVNITFDDQGHADLDECIKTPFGDFYKTHDVQNAFDSFWKDVDGIAESFTNFWQAVALYFKDEPSILGYELINEPNPGTMDNLDQDYLLPLYKRIHDKIRQVDNETIILFEPSIWDGSSVGFDQGPGGLEYNDRQVLAYHIYCGDVNSSGDPVVPALCIADDTRQMLGKAGAAVRLGLAGFMTEFGAVSNSDKAAAEINRVTDFADSYLHSWSYWQFKLYGDFTTADIPASIESFYSEDGSLQSTKVKALARSYAYATCGVPKKQKFDSSTGEFTFTYLTSNECQNQRTEIFLSEEYYYPKGYSVEFSGCDQCELVRIESEQSNYFAVEIPESTAEATEVTLKVSATSSGEIGRLEALEPLYY